MKRFCKVLLFTFFVQVAFSQTDGISYQAIIIDKDAQEIPGRDIEGNYLSEAEVSLQFTIFDELGRIEYQETHLTTTDPFGMINLVIGKGTTSAQSPGLFNQIEWAGKPKELQVDLSYDGSMFEEFSRQDLLFVPFAYHRNITATGTLMVDKETSLNSSLTVERGSPTRLTGDLTVEGNSFFQGNTTFNTIVVENESDLRGDVQIGGDALLDNSLTVEGTTHLDSSLTVSGTSTLNNTLEVSGATSIDNTLDVRGNTSIGGATQINNTLDVEGQVTIRADLTGGEANYDAYPLRVEGSPQGIAIKLNRATPNFSNNFLSFFDSRNGVRGRIEGQTRADLNSSAEFIFETSILSAEVAAGAVNIGLSALPNGCAGVGVVACPPEPSVVAIAIAEEILAVANLAAYQVFAASNLGVTYESGSADYAEWLERMDPAEKIVPGDIVGVIGGKVSKNTQHASKYLVTSTNPGVLGNMPAAGQEDLYEKIAFLGQVPVKVRGEVHIGDFILPSGLNDGTGLAISSEKIKAFQYASIVGIAWSVSPQNSRISWINMAIGLNANDLARLVSEQQNRIEKLEEKFAALEQRLTSGEPFEPKPSPEAPQLVQDSIFAESLELLGNNPVDPVYMSTVYPELVEKALMDLKDTYRAKGMDINKHAGLKKLFNDEAYRKEIIRRVIEN